MRCLMLFSKLELKTPNLTWEHHVKTMPRVGTIQELSDWEAKTSIAYSSIIPCSL